MTPLKDELPARNGVLNVFYDFETIQKRNIRSGERKHSIWEDPVGDMLKYLCKPRPLAKKILAIAQNAKAFELHFILNRAVLLKWQPELIMNALKIM